MDPSSFLWEEKVFIGSPWSKHVPNGRQNDIRGGLLEAKWFAWMAYGVFGGSWVSIGPPGGLPEGLLVDLGFPLRSSVGPWVFFEGQLDTIFQCKVPLACFGKSTCRVHGKLIFEAARFNLGGKTPPRAISGTVLGFFHRKKASTDSEIAPGEVLASRWMATTSEISFPCTRNVDFLKTQRSRWK